MSTVACLEAGPRGRPFFCRLVVPDPRLVVPGDVFADRPPERLEVPVLGLPAVEHLVLHRPEERLHDAVVEAVPLLDIDCRIPRSLRDLTHQSC